MLIALTRAVSPSITECALTYMERRPIDPVRADAQHEQYEESLRAMGAQVVPVSPQPDLPDAVFVEDTAVVVPELAVMTNPALDARRREVETVAEVLQQYRKLEWIGGDGTMEGGDVMRMGHILYAGLSKRTNHEGIEQLSSLLRPHGYEVRAVPVEHCLHLKTAVTALPGNAVLANPEWVDVSHFDGCRVVEVDPSEPTAANALVIGETVLFPEAFPRTRQRLEDAGFTVKSVDSSELEKAEAGLTCCSILLEVATSCSARV